MEEWTEGQKGRQNLFYKNLPATAGGSKNRSATIPLNLLSA